MDREAAEIVAGELERRYAAHPIPRSPTLDDALELLARFKREQAAAGVRAVATADMYAQKAKVLRRVIGAGFELAGMRPRVVDAFISARRAEGVSENTIHKELTALRVALKLAKRAEVWNGDVTGLMPIGFSILYRPRTRALTPLELRALLAQLPPARAAHVAFIVATSARWGESVRARRADIAPDRAWVHLRGTKTELSERTVPMIGAGRVLLEYALDHAPGDDVLFAAWHYVRRDLHDACGRRCRAAGRTTCVGRTPRGSARPARASRTSRPRWATSTRAGSSASTAASGPRRSRGGSNTR